MLFFLVEGLMLTFILFLFFTTLAVGAFSKLSLSDRNSATVCAKENIQTVLGRRENELHLVYHNRTNNSQGVAVWTQTWFYHVYFKLPKLLNCFVFEKGSLYDIWIIKEIICLIQYLTQECQTHLNSCRVFPAHKFLVTTKEIWTFLLLLLLLLSTASFRDHNCRSSECISPYS